MRRWGAQADLDEAQGDNASTAGNFAAKPDVLNGGDNAYYKRSGGSTPVPSTGGVITG